jgi:hypothetical protein
MNKDQRKEGLSPEQIDDLLKRHFDLDWPDKWAYRENAIAAMQEFHERMQAQLPAQPAQPLVEDWRRKYFEWWKEANKNLSWPISQEKVLDWIEQNVITPLQAEIDHLKRRTGFFLNNQMITEN